MADGAAVPRIVEMHGGQVRAARHLDLGPGPAVVVRVEHVAALADREHAIARARQVDQQRALRERREHRRARGRVIRRRVLRECRRHHREGACRQRPSHVSACPGGRLRPA